MGFLSLFRKKDDSTSEGRKKQAEGKRATSEDKYEKMRVALREEEKRRRKEQTKISDTYRLRRALSVADRSLSTTSLDFLVPYRQATIICNSILIDKLGDITKFIIQSLYDGKTIDEIKALTRLGDIAINEEKEYLVHGQLLVERDTLQLTELGYQYGRLLERFGQLAKGIPVALNTYTNLFEETKEDTESGVTQPGVRLREHFILELTRNEKYSNSMKIAEKYIESDMPFCEEIKRSLYTKVVVEDYTHYRRKRLSNFGKSYSKQIEGNMDEARRIPVRMPVDRIVFKAKDKRLDNHRKVLLSLIDLQNNDSTLLTDEARVLGQYAKEESNAKEIVAIADAITGEVSGEVEGLQEETLVSGIETIVGNELEYQWSDEIPDFIRFEEVKRERLYITRYFSYSVLEEV